MPTLKVKVPSNLNKTEFHRIIQELKSRGFTFKKEFVTAYRRSGEVKWWEREVEPQHCARMIQELRDVGIRAY